MLLVIPSEMDDECKCRCSDRASLYDSHFLLFVLRGSSVSPFCSPRKSVRNQ